MTGNSAPSGNNSAPANGDPTPSGGDDDSPVFAMVRESGIDGRRHSLYLVLQSTEGELFRLDFTPGCIPLTVAALSAELGFLQRQEVDLPEPVQPIIADTFQLGETADGAPALLAGMEGGGELPLQTSLRTLRQLARDIETYLRTKA